MPAMACRTANSIVGTYVTSIECRSTNGLITITYFNVKPTDVDGNTITLTPTPTAGSMKWDCASAAINAKYLPSNCR